jgi:hypothetical protein
VVTCGLRLDVAQAYLKYKIKRVVLRLNERCFQRIISLSKYLYGGNNHYRSFVTQTGEQFVESNVRLSSAGKAVATGISVTSFTSHFLRPIMNETCMNEIYKKSIKGTALFQLLLTTS